MTEPVSLFDAIHEVCNNPHDEKAWLAYRKDHNLCSETLRQKVGGYVVRDIVECENRRFDFAEHHQNQRQALVIGAFDELGEREIASDKIGKFVMEELEEFDEMLNQTKNWLPDFFPTGKELEETCEECEA